MSLLLRVLRLEKSLDNKTWTDEDKEIVAKLIEVYKSARKQKTLQDAIAIIDKRRMQNSMFIGAEMDVLIEPDEAVMKVQYENKKLSKAQFILENVVKRESE